MKIWIDDVWYTDLRNLSFAPQVDLVCNALPINEFSVDILTDDDIDAGQRAELLDEDDNLWANYWIDYAERVGKNTVHVRARSEVALLDGVELAEAMYSGAALSDVLDDTMVRQSGAPGIVATIDYTLDNALTSATVTGFCPQQTARERLQWVCFACGAYVKTAFVDKITVLPIDATAALIPLDKTFWKPKVEHGDYVTAIKLTAYTFTQSASAASDNSSYTFPLPWVAATQVFTLDNQNVPAGIQDNVVEIDELYLINQSNVSSILALLADRYFKRTEVLLDAIDNGEFVPGILANVYADEETMYSGYIESASFKFGRQARASIKLTAAEQLYVSALTVNYTYSGTTIATDNYNLPIGYDYSVGTRYLDITSEGVRRVYRPTVASVSGTMASGGNSAEVPCTVALDLYEGVLTVYYVDGVETSSGVGVIS